MQYFIALKLGEKRVKQSQDLLNLYTGNSAMPALALKDTKTNVKQALLNFQYINLTDPGIV